MILKKPYAFLIKNFKKIHLILVLTMGFLFFKSYKIFSFFSEAIANNYSAIVSYDTGEYYVNFFMYFILIVVLGILVAIYYLLHHKNKPRKFYRYAIIYYLILLFFFSFMSGVFKDLFETAFESRTIRAYRDISLIAMVPQIGLIIYSLMTAIGFNIKKFNFGEDLKDLEISDDDNEEFELNVGFEGYKTKRSIRKTIRELKYYFLENKFVISCIGIVGTVVLGMVFITALTKNDNSLDNNAYALNNNFSIKVMDSMITNLLPNGDLIKNDKYYVVIKMEITNITDNKINLDYSNYRLINDDKKLTPDLKASNNFYDFAMPYIGEQLRSNETRIINLAYEIKKSDISNNFVLKIYKGTYNKEDKLVDDYNEVKLKPTKMLDKGDASIVALNEELFFTGSNVGNTKMIIQGFEYVNSYTYNYEVCHNKDCYKINDIITIDYVNSRNNAILMIFDYEFLLDDSTPYYKYNNSLKSFVNNFMKIKYIIGGETKYSSVLDRTPEKLNNKLVVQVDKDVSNADEVQVVFTIRNKNYIIKLK